MGDRVAWGRLMWRIRGLVICLVVVALGAGTRGDEPLAAGHLAGVVVDPDGQPVAGARVWTRLLRGEVLLAETRTGGDGQFRLGPLEPGHLLRVEVFVDADGWARTAIPPGTVSVYPGRDTELGVIRLDVGRVCTGRVLDADGTPRADAAVDVRVRRFNLGHTVTEVGPGWQLATDQDGRFRTPPIAVGHLTVAVRAPDRQRTYVSRPVLPGAEEDLGEFHLEPDVPFSATVTDEATGTPLAGVRLVGPIDRDMVTDAAGNFKIRGLGPNASFQLNLARDGYLTQVGRVTVTEAGTTYQLIQARPRGPIPPAKELVIPLPRVGSIEGRAVDADTGAPVQLDKVALHSFERRPGGEIVLLTPHGDFPQKVPGQFRATYTTPREYHLTLTAPGYHDAEAFAPPVDNFQAIDGIVVSLRRLAGEAPAVARPPEQTITGTVSRGGVPIREGWVALWGVRGRGDPINAPVLRGRMVAGPGFIIAQAPIRPNGTYSLDLPGQVSGFLVLDEPGHAFTQAGPIAVALGERRVVDLATSEPGRVRGVVANVPAEWRGRGFVVAFNRTGIRVEARIASDGSFALPPLPPGEFGLKVGHDAYSDPEVYPVPLDQIPKTAFTEVADPWKRAVRVTVAAGQEVNGVVIAWPE